MKYKLLIINLGGIIMENINKYENYNGKRFTVLSAKIAKQLIREGYRVIDITKSKNDFKKTVFIFADELNIKKRFNEMLYDEE